MSIVFDEQTHTYSKNGIQYTAVTNLLKKYNLSAHYSSYIKPEVLQAAADHGKVVHKMFENYIKQGTIVNDADLTAFIKYITNRNIDLSKALSETIMYNDLYLIAGTVDFQYYDGNDFVIADFKTTSSIHWNSVSWQLSIYNYLNSGEDIMKYYMTQLKVYHIINGKLTVRDVPTIPYEEVINLLTANLAGDPYTYAPDLSDIMSKSEGIILNQLCTEIKQYKEVLKELEGKKEKYQQRLLEAMSTRQIRSCEICGIQLTYKDAHTRTTFNSEKLKEYFKTYNIDPTPYLNVSNIEASVTLTLKGGPNDKS